MVEALSRSGARHRRHTRLAGIALGLLLLAADGAIADDPTRPPPGLGNNTAAPGSQPREEAPPVVTALFITGKNALALVDGRETRVGDRLRDGRVSRIDEAGVWLRTPAGTRLLRLVPDARKTRATAAASTRGKTP